VSVPTKPSPDHRPDRITDSTPRPSPRAGASANRGSSASAPRWHARGGPAGEPTPGLSSKSHIILPCGRAHPRSAAAARRRSAPEASQGHGGKPRVRFTGQPPGSHQRARYVLREALRRWGASGHSCPRREVGGQARPGAFTAATLRPPRRPGSRPGCGHRSLGPSAGVLGNCPKRGNPTRRLPLVDLAPQGGRTTPTTGRQLGRPPSPRWATTRLSRCKKYRRNFAPRPDAPCSQLPMVAVGCWR
jgi:hypothetical protein